MRTSQDSGGYLFPSVGLQQQIHLPPSRHLVVKYWWGKDGKYASKYARSGDKEPLETYPPLYRSGVCKLFSTFFTMGHMR